MFKWLTRFLERRNTHDLAGLFNLTAQSNSIAGVRITEDNVMNFVTAFACIKILSEDLAYLGSPVYERLGNGGKREAYEDPRYRLLNYAPNVEQTPMVFWMTMIQYL